MSETLGKILVTRQLKDEDIDFARSLDLEVVCLPMLSFKFPDDWKDRIQKFRNAGADSWIFTSKNGVLGFEELKKHTDFDLPKVYTYAVGKKTAGELFRMDYKPFIPEKKNAASLAQLIIELGKTKKAIHFCGNRRRKELSEKLNKAGIQLEEIEVYQTVSHPKRSSTDRDIRNILFYSPSSVEAFYKNRPVSEQAVHFAIGPTTAKALGYAGAKNIVMAEEPSTKAILKKVHDYLSRIHEN